ncbi:MAG: redox-sensing transcriptional repressor Rex [Verrucomicrobiota bacterium]|nr:redox-sensing transcriptional repressor Rex [Verrucomicrobiota bacterium]
MLKQAIPRKTVYRLSLYTRSLQRLLENSIETVSSEALAKATGVKPTQLRKDLAYFGQFGKKGLGYNVQELIQKISQLLGTNHLQPVILIGVGDLGSALLSYKGFEKEGFEIISSFDMDVQRHRNKKFSIPILPMTDLKPFIEKRLVKLAILSVPAHSAQSVTNELIAAGITAILNFAPINLDVPDQAVVNNVNLAMELENLSYFIK